MKDILFRGKSIRSNEWVFGGFHYVTDLDLHLILKDSKRIKYDSVYSTSVGQFIGLCDCDGNKVFEGDIIAVNGEYPKVIAYREDHAAFCMANTDDLCKIYLDPWQRISSDWWNDFKREIKIIGNTYDNPLGKEINE